MWARLLPAVVGAVAVLVAAGPARPVAPAPGAAVRKFEGYVISANRSNRSFLMHDLKRQGNFRIHTRKGTRYEKGLRGFQSLRKEIEIEVRATRSEGGRLLARSIELD